MVGYFVSDMTNFASSFYLDSLVLNFLVSINNWYTTVGVHVVLNLWLALVVLDYATISLYSLQTSLNGHLWCSNSPKVNEVTSLICGTEGQMDTKDLIHLTNAMGAVQF